MRRSRLTFLRRLTPVLVLAGAMVAGWFVTDAVRTPESVRADWGSCTTLDGGAEQIACLSDRFEEQATRLAGSRVGAERDEVLLRFVRSTETAAAEDSRVSGLCHPAMHQLGRREGSTAAKADRVPAFPAGSSQLCTAGYVHGLAEGYLTGTPTAQVAAVFPSLCHDTKAREGCAHGVGHALVRAHTTDDLRTTARSSFARCKDLPSEFPTNCQNGVFMELAMRTQPAIAPPTEYVHACRDIADAGDALSCWGYLGLNLRTNDVPIEDVPSWCAKADLPGQFPCIEEFGRSIGVEGIEACADSADMAELQQRCVDGAVGLQVGSGHVGVDEARARCDDLDGELRAYCRSSVKRFAAGRRQVEAN
jgi:hypothetical protein